MHYTSLNPYTEEVFFEAPTESSLVIQEKFAAASSAFESFRKTDFDTRVKILQKLANLLEEQQETLAETITKEMGKPITQSNSEIKKCALVCRYYADNGPEFLSPKSYKTSFSKSYVQYDPIGVVLAVMPWNFPFWQVFRFLAPCIMAGNIGMLKHASNVPQCAEAIEKLVKEAFTEYQLFYNTYASNEDIEWLTGQVAAVTLTGSEKAGSIVAANAGKNIRKTVLELGGSDPFIVLPDADIEKTVEGAIKGRYLNAGQSCISAKRFILHEAIAPEFTTLLKEKLEQLLIGDPMNSDTFMGPMSSEGIRDQLKKQVEDALDKDAILWKTGNIPSEGFFFNPSILTHVPNSAQAFSEELFGPVATVYNFRNIEDAVRLSNESSFGLGSSIWTNDIEKAQELAASIESGSVFINDFVKSNPALPFGGVKNSGYGRELSDFGIHEFVNIKTVAVK